MTNTELRAHLRGRRACTTAMKWLGDRDSTAMWAECDRPDWLIWYAWAHASLQEIVAVACKCARTALKYVPPAEGIPLNTIETAEAWCRGEATLEAVLAAAYAADAYAADAYAAVYAYTDDSDAYNTAAYNAVYAANAAANAAASYTADAAVHAAVYAYIAAAAAWPEAMAEMCMIIRTQWPTCPHKEAA